MQPQPRWVVLVTAYFRTDTLLSHSSNASAVPFVGQDGREFSFSERFARAELLVKSVLAPSIVKY